MPLYAGRDEPCNGNVRCNNTVPDHNDGISRKGRRIHSSGKAFDAEHHPRPVSFSPEGETGQRLPNHVSLMTAEWTPLTREDLPKWTPVGGTIGVLSCSTFRKTLHDDDDELHAFGVDDVEVFIRRVFK